MDYQDQARFGVNEPDEPTELGECIHCAAQAQTVVEVELPQGAGVIDVEVCLTCYGDRYAPVEAQEPTADDVPF